VATGENNEWEATRLLCVQGNLKVSVMVPQQTYLKFSLALLLLVRLEFLLGT
jgi:hypothetical protein